MSTVEELSDIDMQGLKNDARVQLANAQAREKEAQNFLIETEKDLLNNKATADNILDAQNTLSHARSNLMLAELNIQFLHIQGHARARIDAVINPIENMTQKSSKSQQFFQLMFGVLSFFALILLGGIFVIVRKMNHVQSYEVMNTNTTRASVSSSTKEPAKNEKVVILTSKAAKDNQKNAQKK